MKYKGFLFSLSSILNLIVSYGYSENLLQQVQDLGYRLEAHKVVTEDHYILTLYRIRGRKFNQSVTNSIPVFLFHGISFSMNQWLILPETSAAYQLADNGFDVWLGNARGTSYSNEHMELSIMDPKYWNFSWHEIGYYDLPAMVDYILNNTKQNQIHYAGHSQGGTVLLVALSTRPEYNKKITFAFLLAPGSFAGFTSGTIYLFPFEKFLHLIGSNLMSTKYGLAICDNKLVAPICAQVIPLLVGKFSNSESAIKAAKLLGRQVIDYASYKQLLHLNQLIRSGRFQWFDHGNDNFKFYGLNNPPEYNLNEVAIPIILRRFETDLIVSEEAINNLKNKLTHVQSSKTYPSNHIQFLFDSKLSKLINHDLVYYINSYCEKKEITTTVDIN